MKLSALLIFLVLLMFVNNITVAQTSIVKIKGDSLLTKFSECRYNYNRSRIQRTNKPLPQPRFLLDTDTLIITFSHLNYYIINQRLVSISGLPLSKKTLKYIEGKILYLDSLQVSYCTQANTLLNAINCNLTKVKNLDRHFYNTLASLTSLTARIALMIKKEPNISESMVKNL